MHNPLWFTVFLLLALLISCSYSVPSEVWCQEISLGWSPDPEYLHNAPDEIPITINQSITRARQDLDQLILIPDADRTVENALIRFEEIMTRFDDETRVYSYLAMEDPNPFISRDAGQARFIRDSWLHDTYLRSDLARILALVCPIEPLDQQLQEEILERFSYASLSADQKEDLTRYSVELAGLESAYLQNIRSGTATANLVLLPSILEMKQKVVSELGYSSFAEYRISQSGLGAGFFDLQSWLYSWLKSWGLRSGQEAEELLTVKRLSDPQASLVYEHEISSLRSRLSGDHGMGRVSAAGSADDIIRKTTHLVSFLFHLSVTDFSPRTYHQQGRYLLRITDPGSSVPRAWIYLWIRDDEGVHSPSGRSYLVRAGREEGGTWIAPVSVGVISIPGRGSESRILLSPGDQQILFHELGHLLRQSLVTSRYATLSGQDPSAFTEVPSLLFERIFLSLPARRYMNLAADDLPEEETQYGSGYIHAYQGVLALLDLMVHHHTSQPIDLLETYARLYTQYTGFDPGTSGTALLLSPAYLISDNAGVYWHYILDEEYAEELYARFEEHGVINRSVGVQFRRSVFEPAGTAPFPALMAQFLGKNQSPSYLPYQSVTG